MTQVKIEVLEIEHSKYFSSTCNTFIIDIDQRLLTGGRQVFITTVI